MTANAEIWLIAAAAIAAAFAIGSLTSAVVVARVMGAPDPRTAGSGNPGATNMMRLAGRLGGSLTLAGDVLKGTIPVLIAGIWLGGWPLAAVAVAPFLGHLFPLYSGFRHGGKGVATAFGVLLAYAPWIALALAGTWLAAAALFRYSSLSALIAAASAPLWILGLRPEPPLFAVGVVLAALLIWRHEGNIRRLLRGEEGRIGEKAN